MVVAIVSGEEGSGKTSQLLELAAAFPTAVWGIMELKDEEKIMKRKTDTFIPEVLFEEYPDGHEKEGNIDPIRTIQHVEEWRTKIYNMNPLPETIVLDGISDLRAEVTKAWIIGNNKDRVSKGRGPLKSIGEKNIGAWGEVNTWVQEIIDPLITRGLRKHVNVIFTAQMKDKYRDGKLVGIEPALKPYMAYPVPCLFVFSSTEEGYSIACSKEPENPRWHVENVAKHIGFMAALEEHGLLTTVRISDYMIRYEVDGEIKRGFEKAETPAEAGAIFLSKYPGCEVLEVTA